MTDEATEKMRRVIEDEVAEKIASWLEQPTGVSVNDYENAWLAKLIRRGEWKRDRSMDA